jgi:hypothetical protein
MHTFFSFRKNINQKKFFQDDSTDDTNGKQRYQFKKWRKSIKLTCSQRNASKHFEENEVIKFFNFFMQHMFSYFFINRHHPLLKLPPERTHIVVENARDQSNRQKEVMLLIRVIQPFQRARSEEDPRDQDFKKHLHILQGLLHQHALQVNHTLGVSFQIRLQTMEHPSLQPQLLHIQFQMMNPPQAGRKKTLKLKKKIPPQAGMKTTMFKIRAASKKNQKMTFSTIFKFPNEKPNNFSKPG